MEWLYLFVVVTYALLICISTQQIFFGRGPARSWDFRNEWGTVLAFQELKNQYETLFGSCVWPYYQLWLPTKIPSDHSWWLTEWCTVEAPCLDFLFSEKHRGVSRSQTEAALTSTRALGITLGKSDLNQAWPSESRTQCCSLQGHKAGAWHPQATWELVMLF